MLDKTLPYIGVIMIKNKTQDYPRYSLPNGYSYSFYKPGFEKDWALLIYALENTNSLNEAENIFQKEFLTRPDLLKNRCLFILDDHQHIVSTASLWEGNHFGCVMTRIHWVSTAKDHQQKGLVKALMTRLLDLNQELALTTPIYLTSQTWSYKAINIYEHFGFEPYLGDKPLNWKSNAFNLENPKAWEMIHRKIQAYKNLKD
ncbi:hypothetical protein AOC36_04110 [Erysipelothrix larvae]|uniref:N-acetyltransferase domain-containing protein n=1 Tax=Erysipelothrix larvae TaxID=1514105 RepID=A0A0X8GZE8_9FIRM|nr:GNAT family N-acetyltransferase [Erysipelothrix larvae]AMC93184.1 hypothetical protein AOC36_04110 [Erysipelothrix larvae]